MPLRLVGTLGPNVDAMCHDLASALTGLGLDCGYDRTLTHEGRMSAIRGGSADIMWMCGLVAIQMIRADVIEVDVMGAPVFDGETEPVYRSMFAVRQDEQRSLGELFAEGVWAMNQAESWSGHHAVRRHARDAGLIEPDAGRIRWSGSHADSMGFVRSGSVDIAAVDVTIWRWEGREELKSIGSTADWPAPPIMTSDADVGDAIAQLVRVSAVPGLTGLCQVDSTAYEDLLAGI